ncbi:MAG: hypothetical protein N2595_07590 [bacterium]|nr:hypothetical protein [bacterium]
MELAELYEQMGHMAEALTVRCKVLQRALCQQDYDMVVHCAQMLKIKLLEHPYLCDASCRQELSTLAARVPATEENAAVIRTLLQLRE